MSKTADHRRHTGFGRDTAQTPACAGYTVFASIRDPPGTNRKHAETLREQGIAVVEFDIASDDSVERAVQDVLAHNHRVNVLVNNADIAPAVTEAFTPDQAKVGFNTNVMDCFASSEPCCRLGACTVKD